MNHVIHTMIIVLCVAKVLYKKTTLFMKIRCIFLNKFENDANQF